jgi:hypothetical protein
MARGGKEGDEGTYFQRCDPFVMVTISVDSSRKGGMREMRGDRYQGTVDNDVVEDSLGLVPV